MNNELNQKATSISSKSIVANEIVAIFKMICRTGVVCGVYCLAFTAYHYTDFVPGANSYQLGRSCYDYSVSGPLDKVEDCYGELIMNKYGHIIKKHNPHVMWPQDYINAADRMKIIGKSEADELRRKASIISESRLKAHHNRVAQIRIDGFLEDLKKHSVWSLIIVFCFLFMKRYIGKSIKWISENRTE